MRKIRAVFFDIYKTLLDIDTDEEDIGTYAFLSRWLSYHGVVIDPPGLRLKYRELCAQVVAKNPEPHPEADIGEVFAAILDEGKEASSDLRCKSGEVAFLFRMLTTKSISAYPGLHQLLDSLRGKARIGIISNAQRLFTMPELSKFGLTGFFDPIVLSSDLGVRKPGPRIFRTALDAVGVPPEAAVFIGDNLYDDVYGAGSIGMKTIWIDRGTKLDPATPALTKPDFVVKDEPYKELERILSSLL